jgi:hypothetical protein
MSFPTLTLLDSFKRSEEPLSNGGKWKAFFPANSGLSHCNGTDWETHAKTFNEGAYWSPIEFASPGVAITRDQRIEDAGTWWIWACISNPTTSKVSGYRLALVHTGSVGKFEVKLEKCTENSFSVLSTTTGETYELGDKVGLAVQAGKVEYWHKKGAGAWEERANHADSAYTKGFVAIHGEVANGDTTNFEAASSIGGGPTVENPGKQRGHTFKPTSLQIKALNVTKYFATNLPLGLSISESTGLITGEPEAEESPIVKIKVENEAAETAETSFEWIISTRNSNVLSMIVC